ncbi:polysaccharide deacetylase family protein [Bifidobacterium canis]|uniref:Polysaccharide deacetylase family protein n=1 Tax=Bifidobacterium canis TaxID=2610880 RepID=A0A7K1J3H7_9BIFI|nr:polysaccharide deacetylase family protein [Bifidobacterium canis]
MAQDSSEQDDDFDAIHAEFAAEDPNANAAEQNGSPHSPHAKRSTIIAVVVTLLVIAGVLAAIIIPINRAQRRHAEELHATALADCESAQQQFSTMHTTYTATLTNAKKLIASNRNTDFGSDVGKEHATTLSSTIEHIDDTQTVSSVVNVSCNASKSTDELNELARDFSVASTSMVNRMRDVQTETDTLRTLIDSARNSNRRGALQKELTTANAAYTRSEGKANATLRDALNAQIANATALLEPDSAASNEQINTALSSLTQATDAVIDAMPLDCEFTACVALTFDDGPNKQVTPQLLAALRTADAPATFFVQGQFVSGSNKQLLKTMADSGHEIGSMGWRHKQLHMMDSSQLDKWLHDTDDVITSAGVSKPTLFRPPDGAWSDTVVKEANADGQKVILWSVDSRDWDTNNTNIAQSVVDAAEAGSIVALHDGNERTVAAIPQIVSGLRSKGLTLVTVSKLLEGENGSLYYSR